MGGDERREEKREERIGERIGERGGAWENPLPNWEIPWNPMETQKTLWLTAIWYLNKSSSS
jgi:hypothetical protein